MAIRTLSLCTGYGGIELGLRLAGVPVRVVAAVERQAYAAAVLASRMGEGALDSCPIWDDLESFDGRAWRGCVDLVTAGFPCQGASVAGKRLGTADKRWLWPHVWRAVVDCGASMLLVENVPGLLTVNRGDAFAEILGALAARGWIAEWDVISAASVGAPHLRERVFLLAADPGSAGPQGGGARGPAPNGAGGRQAPAHASSIGPGPRDDGQPRANERADTTRGRGEDAPHADGDGPQGERHLGQLDQGGRAQRGNDLDRCNVSPEWARIVGRAAPEPSFRDVDDGAAVGLGRDWHERLHLLGNGVVPQAAARAWEVLSRRLWP